MFPRLQDFTGEWRVTRDIAHADGAAAKFEGRARFVQDGAKAVYSETGTLRLATGESIKAERRYLWAEDQIGTLQVFFEDGRHFHEISAEETVAEHWCGPDTYHVTYDFGDWPSWSSVWRVKGPRKDYCMTSHYWRTLASS